MLGSMRATSLIRPWRAALYGAFALGAPLARAAQAPGSPSSAQVTTVRQIRRLATQTPEASYSFALDGDVWWANPAQGELVLKDDSGAEELEMDLAGQPLAAGQRVHLEGNGTITPTGSGFRLGANGPVVDNDGVHGMVEKSGAVFLKAGRNPIRLEWFNGVESFGLEAQYQGPDLSRRKIADSALFRLQTNPASGVGQWVNGLDFKCCQVSGQALPDFKQLPALKTGVTDNFDLSVMTQPEHVGLCFTGFLDVPRAGLYRFYLKSDDGSRLFAGEPSLQATVLGRVALPKPEPLFIGQSWRDGDNGLWVEVTGKVTFASQKPDGLKLELSAGAGRLRAEVADDPGLSPALLWNRHVRATGFCQGVSNVDGQGVPGVLLVPGRSEIVLLPTPAEAAENRDTNARGLPLLVTAAEVHRLKREEARRGYPVRIRGVITSVLPEHQAFTLQDWTRGLYIVDFSESRSRPPRIGEFLEVEGVTDPSLFAPVVNARRVRGLGAGEMPEPVHPTRDQLLNGSLDAQYVEIQGVLTSVQEDGVNLLTPDGRIKTDLRVPGLQPQDLARYEDALVRVRGCLFATWDYLTHQVRMGEIRVYGADITVEQPAPADLFSTPRKTAAQLLLFDPQAGIFQRVRVSGQIIHVRGPECFMMDGRRGVRFIPKHPAGLAAGDWVEVVGFPQLSSASPVLREAVARQTGHAALPAARAPDPADLIRSDLDSTLVRVEALLVNHRNTGAEQALEMRVGLRTFLAWLPGKEQDVRAIPEGSRLALTGTYASLGGSRPGSQDVASFELLLNSPADIAVLARPPWWTLARLLVILGALACVLAVTVLWITQLRRKVEQRTAELEVQIRQRQRVEQQHDHGAGTRPHCPGPAR